MPATSIVVQRHELSLALVPGVTGRHDVYAARRHEVLGKLRPALDAVVAAGGRVTVVAPALRARTTTQAQPDLGASGFLADSHGPVLAQGEPALHVTASAAVLLLRLAGWSGEITTREIGPDGGVSAAELVRAEVSHGPGALTDLADTTTWDADRVSPHGAQLIVFACAQAAGVLPVGASALLAQAEDRTHALFREVVALDEVVQEGLTEA